jgi:hypothetical protein
MSLNSHLKRKFIFAFKIHPKIFISNIKYNQTDRNSTLSDIQCLVSSMERFKRLRHNISDRLWYVKLLRIQGLSAKQWFHHSSRCQTSAHYLIYTTTYTVRNTSMQLPCARCADVAVIIHAAPHPPPELTPFQSCYNGITNVCPLVWGF